METVDSYGTPGYLTRFLVYCAPEQVRSARQEPTPAAPPRLQGACTMRLMVPGQPRFMQQAIALATENVVHGRGGPFGAVIVKDGIPVATGANQVTASNDPTAHAEIVAIRNACQALRTFQLVDCDMYTSSEPCPICLAALNWAHCRAIYYGNSAADATQAGFHDSFLYDEIRRPHNERTIPLASMLPDEARVSFVLWQKSPYRVAY